MARKQVLVQLTEELLAKVDAFARMRGESRSALVREAVEKYVVEESAAEKDRRLIAGYSRVPADDGFDDIAEWSARKMLDEESW